MKPGVQFYPNFIIFIRIQGVESMLILTVLGIAIPLIILLLILAYFIQPAFLSLPYTLVISIFVKNPPFVDLDEHFPGHEEFEAQWRDIRDELEEVLKKEEDVPKFHEVDKIQRFISARDDIPWRTFVIKGFGEFVEKNAERVPKTTVLLKKHPEITTAMFSILDGGKHIPRHMGFFRGVFRYHLGLMVPENGNCYITVGGKDYHWKEGEGVLFDDTYKHEVWNKSDQRRVVLFCDLLREASLPEWLRPINRKLYKVISKSARIQKGLKRAEVPRDIVRSPD